MFNCSGFHLAFIARPLVWIGLFFFAMGSSVGYASNDRDAAIQQLAQLREANHQRLLQLENLLRDALSKKDFEQLEQWSDQHQERLLRQDLYDRLAFALTDRYRPGKPLRVFLSTYLFQISEIEIKSNGTKSKLWRPTLYLSEALKSRTESFETPIDFIQSYIEFSSLTSPMTAEKFLELRNYSNGRDFKAANGAERTEVGLLTEKKIAELNDGKKTLPQMQAPIRFEVKSQSPSEN